jgi:hypothetical protein
VSEGRGQGKAHAQSPNEQLRLCAIHQPVAGLFSQYILGTMDAAIHQFATPPDLDRELIAPLVQAQVPAIARYGCAIE